MAALLTYLVTTIMLPALASAAAAIAIARSPVGRTPGFARAAAGTACAVAVLWSFVAESDVNAVLRQLPVTMPGDDAPCARWHRVGLVALVVAVSAPVLAVAASVARPRKPAVAEAAVGVAAGAALAIGVGFPGDGTFDRTATGISVAVAAAAIAASAPRVGLGSAAATALAVAGLAAVGGFISLAAIAAALALAVLALAAAGRSRPIPGVALAVLLATLAACGHGYRDDSSASWPWRAALAIPVLGWAGGRMLRKKPA